MIHPEDALLFSSGFLAGVKGYLDESEGLRLYELAVAAGSRGPCLEVGSYCGKSAVYLGAGCRRNRGVLFSVDHHRGSEEHQPGEQYFDPELYDCRFGRVDTFRMFQRTLETAGLTETVIPLVCASSLAARFWTTALGLVFIDGGHSEAAAAADYAAWAGHVAIGGYLVIHDIFKNPEEGGQAPFAIYQRALRSGRFTELPMTETLGVLLKKGPPD